MSFTAIGVVTSDPASVETVCGLGSAIAEEDTEYLIVENSVAQHTDFRYWQESAEALERSSESSSRP